MRNLYTDTVFSSAFLSFSFNDYSRNCSSSFNGGYPSSSCCFCCSSNCCSSTPIKSVSSSRLVPVNPSPFYGFRQSALIQRAPSRRRMICDLGSTRNSSCIRDLGFDSIQYQGMKSKGKGIGFSGNYARMSVLEERYTLHKVEAACDDAEAIISLLTEDLSDDNISVGQRRKKVSKLSKEGRVKNVEAQGRKEGYRMKHERKDYVKGNDSKLRKGRVTSGSSYYLCSDLSDSEVLVAKYEECTGNGSKQDSRKRVGGVAIKEQAKQVLEGRRIDKNGRREYINELRQSESRFSSSHKDSSLKTQYNSRVGESVTKVNSSDIRRSGYRVKDNRASGTVTSKASDYVVSAGEASDSSYKFKHITDSSDYLSKVSGSAEHLVSAGGFCRTCGLVNSGSEAGSRQKESSSLIQKTANEVDEQHKQFNLRKFEDYTEREDAAESYEDNTNIFRRRSKLPETQNTDMRLTSIEGQQSETRIKRKQEKSSSSQTSLMEVNEKIHQQHLVDTAETDLTRKNQEHTETKVASRQESARLIQRRANEVHEQHKQERFVSSSEINLRKSEEFTERADAAETYKDSTNISRCCSKLSETQNTDMRLTSIVGQQSESRIKRQEEKSTLSQASLKEVNERSHQEHLVVNTETELRRKNQERIETKGASRQESSSLIQRRANEVDEQHKQEHRVSSNQINLIKSEDYTESYEDNSNIFRRRSKLSETQTTDMKLASLVGQQSEIRKRQEEKSALSQTPLEEVNEKSHQEQLVVNSQTDLMRKSHEGIESVDRQEARLKDSEENVVQTGMRVMSRKQPRKSSKAQSGSSQVQFDRPMIVESSRASEERLHYEQSYLTERVKETHEHVKETIKQTEIRYEVHAPLRKPSFVKDRSRHPFVTSTSQVRIEEIGEDRDRRQVTHEHAKETVKQTELGCEVHTPHREPSFFMDRSRYPSLTSTSQVRIEEIDKDQDEGDLPCGSSPRLGPHPQNIEVAQEQIVKQTEFGYEVQTPRREQSFVMDRSRHSSVTSTSQVRIEEIDEDQDTGDLPSGPSPRLDPYPQFIEVTHEHAKETLKQTELRYEVQAPLREPGFNKETSRHPYLTTTSQVRIEEIGEQEDERNFPSMQSPKFNPPSQPVEIVESGSSFPSRDSCRHSGGESSIFIDPQFTDAPPYSDLLASAELIDNSCHQVVGDSVEKIRHEESTSVIEVENKLPEKQLLSDENLPLEQPPKKASGIVKRSGRALWNVLTYGVLTAGDNVSGETSNELNIDKTSSQAIVSNRVQSDSIYKLQESGKEATKSGAMDQINDVTDLSLTFSSEENAAELRRGTLQRSNQVMEVKLDESDGAYRLESERRKTDRKFRRRAKQHPPSQSIEVHPVYVDSTVTFPSQDSCRNSGGEPSIYTDPQSTDASLHVDLQDSAELMDSSFHQVVGDSVEKIRHEESTSVTDVENKLSETQLPSDEKLPQSGIVKKSGRALWNVLAYGVLSTGQNVSEETKNDLNVDKMTSQATMSTDRVQSDAISQLQESGKEATIGGSVDQIKDDTDSSLSVVSSSEENAAEKRRGVLQRSNQVMKERFEEWDEAYKLESEQRKIDQTFMREALEEAKKAADMWEVPVGAVLVQEGKIIARGHNLVEDTRDSTAHAEMVCIRAASSILKTWRLSDTTLYVTLEPCAMCAGAILQARISTLVYGAPNKLLGADGSWVRLFPRSVNGEGGSESTSKSEGPIHPFHPNMKIRRGILDAECGDLMQQSFKLRRNKDKKTEQHDEQKSSKKLHKPSKLLHKMHHKFNILFHL